MLVLDLALISREYTPMNSKVWGSSLYYTPTMGNTTCIYTCVSRVMAIIKVEWWSHRKKCYTYDNGLTNCHIHVCDSTIPGASLHALLQQRIVTFYMAALFV